MYIYIYTVYIYIHINTSEHTCVYIYIYWSPVQYENLQFLSALRATVSRKL